MHLFIVHPMAQDFEVALKSKFPETSFNAATNEEEIQGPVEKMDILLTSSGISDELIKKASSLEWIHTSTSGIDHLTRLHSLRKETLISSSHGIHGPQVSEMATLSIEHIDFKRAAITVTRTKKQRRRPETLAISKYLAKHLKEYISWADQKKGPLFVGKRGPLTRRGLQQIWLSATRRVGMDEMSIHSARHSMAVHLLKKTRNLRQVQKQLGHASPATTANMYADISFEDMQEGVNGLYDD